MLPTSVMPNVSRGAAPAAEHPPQTGRRPDPAGFGRILADRSGSDGWSKETEAAPAAAQDGDAAAPNPDPDGGKDLPEPAIAILPPLVAGPVLTDPSLAAQPDPVSAAAGAPPTTTALAAGAAAPEPDQARPAPSSAAGKKPGLPALPPVPPRMQGLSPLPVSASNSTPRAARLHTPGESDRPAPAAAAFSLLAESRLAARKGNTASELLLANMAELQAPAAALAVPAGSSAAAAQPAITPAAAQGPQDFAQLIDRLVAARDAAQPHSVTVAVNHADFGAVELRFHKDGAGLSVALASADPDFTRAVQAAMPPASSSNEGQGGLSRHHGSGGAPPEQHSGQSHTAGRGHDSLRHDAPPNRGRLRADRSSAPAAERQHGIFA